MYKRQPVHAQLSGADLLRQRAGAGPLLLLRGAGDALHHEGVDLSLIHISRSAQIAIVRGADTSAAEWQLPREWETVSYTHLDVYKRQ